MDGRRQEERSNVNEQNELFFGIISRSELTWSEHKGTIVEAGDDWVRIETREPIKPGYVWLRNRIKGNRGGFLEWSMQLGGAYRARIRIVPLTWNVEHYVRERARRSLAHIPLRDPAEIIAAHMDSFARGTRTSGKDDNSP
ncbi:MAG: hypothetical protein A2078_15695 [Nitrospirae bacterium GWC2_57_9]|nr:MAG: hypothetical protein A2078_15695 [Nitrospirae bacterium GWC2_57_9]